METGVTDIITDPVNETTCIKCHHLMDVAGLPSFVQIACPECGTQQHVPAKMGAFLLVDLLGKGGMGAVYRGRDTGLDRWVAVKVMQSSFGGNPAFVETFRREAQAAAALNHPNIVQIYSFGVAHGQPYMVMELLEGGRLDQMIAKGELLNEALVLKIGVDVAEGLNAAAAINLIHGDVKPENILLDNNGIAKVVDFGLARFKESKEGGGTQGIWGTPYYIAPEKLRGHPSDARSDIYSLGGTLFHALTLKPPFDGETPMDVVKARLKQPAPLVGSLRPDTKKELEAIVSRMLEAEPARRYPNYASALSDMRRVLSTMKLPTAPLISPTLKKGGKIILAKKKGATELAVSTPITAAASGPIEETKEEAKPHSGKLVKMIGLGVAGMVVLAGLIAGGMVWHKASQRSAAATKEKAAAVQHRKHVEKIGTDLQTLMADLAVRETVAKGWVSNASLSASIISAAMSKMPDSPSFVAMGSNAEACASVANDYLTVQLTSASTELKGFSDLVATNLVVMKPMTNAAPALERLLALTNIPARCLAIQETILTGERKTKAALETLDGLKKKMDSVLKEAAVVAARETAEKAEADRLAAEKAKAEREEAEKAARIQAELQSLVDLRKANVTMMQRHEFKQANEAIEQAARSLKTPEGKAAARQTVKAYQTLADLKAAFVEGMRDEIKANPDTGFSYGWMKQTDILHADDLKVELRGGQKISWSEFPPRQIIVLYQRFVENGTLARPERARCVFAMALYVYDTMPGNESARKQVAKYLAEAVGMTASLEETAKVVMPDIVFK